MFYDDSDDSDDGHLVFGYGGYGWNGWNLWDSDDYGEYYDDYYSGYSGYSDSGFSYLTENSTDDFYETGHNPSMFPDALNFHLEYARCISRIRSSNSESLFKSCLALAPITAKLETPIFEQLWESLFYLRRIVCVGQNRSKLIDETSFVHEGIKNIYDDSVDCFTTLPEYVGEMANKWFVWCNDLLIETIQKLIPFSLPYTAWESIIGHLSHSPYSKIRTLLTDIKTVSEGDEARVVERCLVRECILKTVDITKMFYLILYSRLPLVALCKIKQKLPLFINGFNNSMERFACFLESSELPSKCMNQSVKNRYSKYIWDIDTLTEDELQEDLNLFKMIGVSTAFQHQSTHFVILVADIEEENFYTLLCIDKNTVDSPENVNCITLLKALESEELPSLFSCGNFVAGIGLIKKERVLTVWEVSEGVEKIFTISLPYIEDQCKEKESSLMLASMKDLKVLGIAKYDKTIKLMFSVMFSWCDINNNEEDSGCSWCEIGKEVPGCIVGEYDLDKFKKTFTFFKKKFVQSSFTNALPLGMYKNFAFIMHLEMYSTTLYTHDTEKDSVVTNKISLKNGQDWRMQFNCNPASDLCLLWKGNHLQIRQLDKELTIVEELNLDLNFQPPLLQNRLEFQFYDNIIYGVLNDQPNLHEIEEGYTKYAAHNGKNDISLSRYLTDKFINVHVVHFLVDIGSQDKQLVYLQNTEDSDTDSSFNEDDVVNLQFFLTSFNKEGNLVQLSMILDVEECFVQLNSDIAACCPKINFTIIEFLNSFKDVTDMMLPGAQKVVTRYKKDVAEQLEAQKKRDQELQELRERLQREQEKEQKKREAKKAKDDQRKQRKWQKRIQAEKERKEAQQLRNFADSASNRVQNSLMSASDERVVNVKKYVDAGITFTSTIHAWMPVNRYGFSSVDIDGKIENVFVHESSVPKNERHRLCIGCKIEYKLQWNLQHPRPKAVKVKVL